MMMGAGGAILTAGLAVPTASLWAVGLGGAFGGGAIVGLIKWYYDDAAAAMSVIAVREALSNGLSTSFLFMGASGKVIGRKGRIIVNPGLGDYWNRLGYKQEFLDENITVDSTPHLISTGDTIYDYAITDPSDGSVDVTVSTATTGGASPVLKQEGQYKGLKVRSAMWLGDENHTSYMFVINKGGTP
jgi:hypothetical protein